MEEAKLDGREFGNRGGVSEPVEPPELGKRGRVNEPFPLSLYAQTRIPCSNMAICRGSTKGIGPHGY